MKNEQNGPHLNDDDLKAALRDALATPFGDVDWDRLHARIMTDAGTRVRAQPRRAFDWLAAWSWRGVPFAAAGLAAAVLALWIVPVERPAAHPHPAGYWTVADELVTNLPEPTRELLLAGSDVESLLSVVITEGAEERDNR
jgi:hypothetical protein